MDLASTLIKQIIVRQDIGTWTLLRKAYLPKEFHSTWNALDSFFDRYSKVPTFEEVLLDVRVKDVKEKLYALNLQKCEDTDPELLLDFLKNEKAQEIAFDQFTKLVEASSGFETAQDTIESLQDIVVNIENKVDLEDPEHNMQRVELFDPEDELTSRYSLGLNKEFDTLMDFSSTAYILIGGKRGSGKSIICCNSAANAYMEGESSIIFTVEMEQREILQRICSICTGISNRRITKRNLSITEWEKVAQWWSNRYQEGDVDYTKYLEHRDFDKLHTDLIRKPLNEFNQIEIIYDPELTLGRIRSELERKVPTIKPKVIVVDYVNQVKLSKLPTNGQFDWKDQIQISKSLKSFAQRYRVPVVSAFQTDASGEARFAKGILDSADAVFNLTIHDHEVEAITFECAKIRSGPETDFTTEINWDSLKVGPKTVIPPKPEEPTESIEENMF